MEATDIELAACDSAQQGIVIWIEQIKSGIGAAFLFDSLGKLVEFVSPGTGIFDGGKELQVAVGSQNFIILQNQRVALSPAVTLRHVTRGKFRADPFL